MKRVVWCTVACGVAAVLWGSLALALFGMASGLMLLSGDTMLGLMLGGAFGGATVLSRMLEQADTIEVMRRVRELREQAQ